MDGDQKEQVKKAMEGLGGGLKQAHGKDVEKISRDTILNQTLPKNALGLTEAMVEGLYSQAYRLYNTGKYKDASQLFRLLIMLNPTEPKFSMGMAACFHMMHEYQNALNTYALCGIIDPDSPVPHYHASDCYIQLKDYVSAIISLEMAIKRAGAKPQFQSLKDRSMITLKTLKKEAKLNEDFKSKMEDLVEGITPSKEKNKTKKNK